MHTHVCLHSRNTELNCCNIGKVRWEWAYIPVVKLLMVSLFKWKHASSAHGAMIPRRNKGHYQNLTTILWKLWPKKKRQGWRINRKWWTGQPAAGKPRPDHWLPFCCGRACGHAEESLSEYWGAGEGTQVRDKNLDSNSSSQRGWGHETGCNSCCCFHCEFSLFRLEGRRCSI